MIGKFVVVFFSPREKKPPSIPRQRIKIEFVFFIFSCFCKFFSFPLGIRFRWESRENGFRIPRVSLFRFAFRSGRSRSSNIYQSGASARTQSNRSIVFNANFLFLRGGIGARRSINQCKKIFCNFLNKNNFFFLDYEC